MPQSGVKIPDECIVPFTQLKLHKEDVPSLCIVYQFNKDYDSFEIYKRYPKDNSRTQQEQYEEIMDHLVSLNYPTVAIWDLKLPVPSGMQVQQQASGQESDYLVSMSLCLDHVPIRLKMMFASSKKSLTDKLDGLKKKAEVMDTGETKYDVFLQSLRG